MDLCDEKEHIISSDEYSDNDYDDDALMNVAIRAQNDIHIRPNKFAESNKQKWKIYYQQKQLSSFTRRSKISIIYKNKSIRWLNNKRRRERYKTYININAKKNLVNVCDNYIHKYTNDTSKSKINCLHTEDVNVVDDEHNNEDQAQTTKRHEIETKLQKVLGLGSREYYISNETIEKPEGNVQHEAEYIKQLKEIAPDFLKVEKKTKKRTRSSSLSLLNDTDETEIKHDEKKIRVQHPQFYRSINDMFPKFDKMATNHINAIASNIVMDMENKMKNLLNEISTLKEILHTKEMEWNRLLHLKMVKEEIYSRLCQKKHYLQLKENYTKKNSQNTLIELKELEFYFSEKKNEINLPTTTIQKLIENRANMNTEDLKREANYTNRLHSLLLSSNVLHSSDLGENVPTISNGEKIYTSETNKKCEIYHNLDSEALPKKVRQEGLRDVKSIIADFRQKNPELLPRVARRTKSNELNTQQFNFSIPEKTSRSQYVQFPETKQSGFYPLRNSVEELSATPIERDKKLLCGDGIDFVKSLNNHYNVSLEDDYLKNNVKRDLDEKNIKNAQYPMCQECKTNESRFVCAGCGNQWYCSKKCQVSAWDKHSEICTE